MGEERNTVAFTHGQNRTESLDLLTLCPVLSSLYLPILFMEALDGAPYIPARITGVLS